MAGDLPEAHQVAPGRHAIHGTAVALGEAGLLILGASGSGKSSLAAELIAFGASLVSDDRVDITDGPRLARPEGAPSLIELRGLGIVAAPSVPEVAFTAALLLSSSTGRLPEPETACFAGHSVPLLRHVARAGLAAKLHLWLRAAS